MKKGNKQYKNQKADLPKFWEYPLFFSFIRYLGAFLYRKIAINVYKILGIHTATIGGVLPFTAKVADTVWNKMYEKLKAKPIPRYNPIPPFTLRADNETPITVKIKAANDIAIR